MKKKPKRKAAIMGRPEKPINWDTVAGFLKYQAPKGEIAAYLGVDEKTLRRKCLSENKMTFAQFSKEKKDIGKLRLRQLQTNVAEKGNVTMLIWLGKQNLGQQDRPDAVMIADRDIIIKFANDKKEKKI